MKEEISQIYAADSLESYIGDLYKSFADGRKPREELWEECWYNYISKYNPKTTLTSTEGVNNRSKVFVRLTLQKIRAAHAKIMESLGVEVPFRLVPLNDTPKLEYQLEGIAQRQKDVIRNQFKRIGLRDILDTEIELMCIFGTCILKAPILTKKTVSAVRENIRQVGGLNIPMWKIPFANFPRFKRIYKDEYIKNVIPVSIWDFYTDNNADSADKSIGSIERKYYSPYEFQQMFFNNDDIDQNAAIRAYNLATTTKDTEKNEVTLGDSYMGEDDPKDIKIAVLEFWGQAPFSLIKPYIDMSDEELEGIKHKDTDLVECSVLLAGQDSETNNLQGSTILQAKLNPTGERVFKVCPFIKVPGSPWGMGVAECMKDSQAIINSFTRLMIDNKSLSGNSMFVIQKDQIDERATKSGFKLFPGKIFFSKSAAKDAVTPLIFPDITGGLEQALDRFERWADEESGIPKYTQGEAAASYLNKTASGMSMIINQSNIFLKTTIRNIDQYLIKPIAKAFNELNEIDGSYPADINIPMDIVPMGVDSLMAKEIKFESAMKLFQVAKETDMLPYINKSYALRLVSDLLDVKGLVVNEVEAEKISQQLAVNAQNAPQATLSANIGSDLLNALSSAERAQVVSKLGIQGDMNAADELYIRKAQELDLETQSKIMINDRKELGKAQGKAADTILTQTVKNKEAAINDAEKTVSD